MAVLGNQIAQDEGPNLVSPERYQREHAPKMPEQETDVFARLATGQMPKSQPAQDRDLTKADIIKERIGENLKQKGDYAAQQHYDTAKKVYDAGVAIGRATRWKGLEEQSRRWATEMGRKAEEHNYEPTSIEGKIDRMTIKGATGLLNPVLMLMRHPLAYAGAEFMSLIGGMINPNEELTIGQVGEAAKGATESFAVAKGFNLPGVSTARKAAALGAMGGIEDGPESAATNAFFAILSGKSHFKNKTTDDWYARQVKNWQATDAQSRTPDITPDTLYRYAGAMDNSISRMKAKGLPVNDLNRLDRQIREQDEQERFDDVLNGRQPKDMDAYRRRGFKNKMDEKSDAEEPPVILGEQPEQGQPEIVVPKTPYPNKKAGWVKTAEDLVEDRAYGQKWDGSEPTGMIENVEGIRNPRVGSQADVDAMSTIFGEPPVVERRKPVDHSRSLDEMHALREAFPWDDAKVSSLTVNGLLDNRVAILSARPDITPSQLNDLIIKKQADKLGSMRETTPAAEPITDTQAQVDAIRDPGSAKDAALITPKSEPVPTVGLITVPTDQGTFVTSNPEKARAVAEKGGKLTTDETGELLDYTTPKAESDGTVVQAKDAEGNVVNEEATNQANLDVAKRNAERMMPEGGTVEVTDAGAALERRAEKTGAEKPQAEPQPAERPNAQSDGETPNVVDLTGRKEPWEMTREEFDEADISGEGYDYDIDGNKTNAGKIKSLVAAWGKRKWEEAGSPIGMAGDALLRQYHKYGTKDGERRIVIEQALAEGKPVPPSVLADYPELAKAVERPAPTKPSNRKKNGGVIARTKPKERMSVDDGTIYTEYRIRKVSDKEYWDEISPSRSTSERSRDGRYVLEQRTIQTEKGRPDNNGNWELHALGTSKEQLIDHNYHVLRKADSLDDTLTRKNEYEAQLEKEADEVRKRENEKWWESKALKPEYDERLRKNMPKGRRGKIKIPWRDKENDHKPITLEIDATIYGDWAINSSEAFNKAKQYAVTHVESGRALGFFPSLSSAKQAISAIHDAGVKLMGDVDKAPKEVLDQLWSIKKAIDAGTVPEYYVERQRGTKAKEESAQPARPTAIPEPTMAQPKRVSTTPAVKSETVEEALARGVKPTELPPATEEMAKAEEAIDREAVNLGATENAPLAAAPKKGEPVTFGMGLGGAQPHLDKLSKAIGEWKDKSKIPFVKHHREDQSIPHYDDQSWSAKTQSFYAIGKMMDNLGIKGARRGELISNLLRDLGIPGDTPIRDLSIGQKHMLKAFLENAQTDVYGKVVTSEASDYRGVTLDHKFVEGYTNVKDLPEALLGTLQLYRAADMIDPSGTLYKHTAIPYEEAYHAIRTELDTFKRSIRSLLPGVSQRSKLSAQIQDFAEGLIDISEIPPAWRDKAQRFAAWSRNQYDAMLPRINEARRMVGKEEVKPREDYFTHGRELGFLSTFFGGAEKIPNEVAKLSGVLHPTSPYFKYLKRLGGEYEADAIGNFQRYMENALRTVHYTPVMVEGKAYIRHLPPNAHKYFQAWSDEVLGGKKSSYDRVVEQFIPEQVVKGAGWVRRRMIKNILGGSVRMFVQQPSSFATTMAELSAGPARNLKDVAANISDAFMGHVAALTKDGQKILELSPEYRDRLYVEDINPDLLSKTEYALQYLNQHMDRHMVGGAFLGKYRQLIRQGMEHGEAIIESDKFAKRTQASYQTGMLPPVMRSEAIKSVLPMQTFTFNFMHHIGLDVTGMVKEHGVGQTMKHGLGLIASCAAVNALYQASGMRETWDWMSLVPGLGMVKYGPTGPLMLIRAALDYTMGDKELGDKSSRKLAEKVAWDILPPFGGEQIRKSIDGILTIRDPSRKPYHFKNDWERLMAVLFGPGSTESSIKYWERREHHWYDKYMNHEPSRSGNTRTSSSRTTYSRQSSTRSSTSR